ncbi:STAS domain-containing protein [Streptomyces sp. M19]
MLDAPLTVGVTTTGPDVAAVTVKGELDAESGRLLHQELSRQIAAGRRHLVLDLADVPFMDSSGLSIVIRTHNAVRDLAGSLRLAAPTDVVRRLLDLTGISMSTPLYDDVETALAAAEAA